MTAPAAASVDRGLLRRRIWVVILLAPHLAAIAGLAVARWVRLDLGTNRSEMDLTFGGAGVVLALAALVATLVALLIRPWRAARLSDWLWLAAHIAALAGALLLAHDWLGAHIA